MGPLAPSPLLADYQSVAMETFLTLTLMLVVFGALDEKNRKIYMPALPIGCTIALNISIMGHYTGSSMNPALCFGPAVVTGKWRSHWVYWVGPLLGSVLAAVLYKYVFILIQEKFGPDSSSPKKEGATDKRIGLKRERTSEKIAKMTGQEDETPLHQNHETHPDVAHSDTEHADTQTHTATGTTHDDVELQVVKVNGTPRERWADHDALDWAPPGDSAPVTNFTRVQFSP